MSFLSWYPITQFEISSRFAGSLRMIFGVGWMSWGNKRCLFDKILCTALGVKTNSGWWLRRQIYVLALSNTTEPSLPVLLHYHVQHQNCQGSDLLESAMYVIIMSCIYVLLWASYFEFWNQPQDSWLIWCIFAAANHEQLPYRFSDTFSVLVVHFNYRHVLVRHATIHDYKLDLILMSSQKIPEFLLKYAPNGSPLI